MNIQKGFTSIVVIAIGLIIAGGGIYIMNTINNEPEKTADDKFMSADELDDLNNNEGVNNLDNNLNKKKDNNEDNRKMALNETKEEKNLSNNVEKFIQKLLLDLDIKNNIEKYEVSADNPGLVYFDDSLLSEIYEYLSENLEFDNSGIYVTQTSGGIYYNDEIVCSVHGRMAGNDRKAFLRCTTNKSFFDEYNR